jgi:cephalosporin hydroxylase
MEHRVDGQSEQEIKDYISRFKPTNALEIGSWEGGSTIAIVSALLGNGLPFNFVSSELLDDKRKATEINVLGATSYKPKMIGDITKNLKEVPDKLDFLMVDTDHDLATTIWILDNIFPKLKKGALVIFHDWAVAEIEGKWIGKGEGGVGGWPETQYMMELHEQGKLPLKKLYWNWENTRRCETGFFTYEK